MPGWNHISDELFFLLDRSVNNLACAHSCRISAAKMQMAVVSKARVRREILRLVRS